MRWHLSVLALASATSLLAAASTARADHALVSQYEDSRVGLAAEIWPTSDFGLATMSIEGQLAVTRNIAFDFGFPNWSFGGANGKGYGDFGGVTFGAHGVGHVDRDIVLWGGFAMSIPTTWKNPNLTQFTFDVLSAETRADFDLGRVVPELMTVKFPLGAEMKFDFIYLRPSLAIPIYVPVGDASGPGSSVSVAMELAGEVEARHPSGFGGGLRLQAFFLLTNDNLASGGDHAQAALEPFVGYEAPPGRGAAPFARLGLLLALDTPLGFGFDKDKLAAIDIKAGVKF
jgi:hypothetical protein